MAKTGTSDDLLGVKVPRKTKGDVSALMHSAISEPEHELKTHLNGDFCCQACFLHSP